MNMQHYHNLKAVPLSALKEIGFGKLKGKSDINPQWRYEAMTQEFGVCGIGWKYDIVKTWTQEANDGQLMVFVEIALFLKDGDSWSGGIPAIGGDFLLEKDKNGLHGNDEAYKMATTDALGVAMKMLGVAADVYRGLANDSKYGREPQKPQNTPVNKPVSTTQQNAIKEKTSIMVKLVKECNFDAKTMGVKIQEMFNVASSKDLNEQQLDELIVYLETMKGTVVDG